jgi:hypothetical protein
VSTLTAVAGGQLWSVALVPLVAPRHAQARLLVAAATSLAATLLVLARGSARSR